MFRSGLEGKVATLLSSLKVPYEYETTKLAYVLECNYIPDFLLPNGIYLEVKGRLTSEDRRKMKAVKKSNPELDRKSTRLNSSHSSVSRMPSSA